MTRRLLALAILLVLDVGAAPRPSAAQDIDALTYLRETPVNLLTWGIRQNELHLEFEKQFEFDWGEFEYRVRPRVLFDADLQRFIVIVSPFDGFNIPAYNDEERRYVCETLMIGVRGLSGVTRDGAFISQWHSGFSGRFLNYGDGETEIGRNIQRWIDQNTLFYINFPNILVDENNRSERIDMSNFYCYIDMSSPIDDLAFGESHGLPPGDFGPLFDEFAQ